MWYIENTLNMIQKVSKTNDETFIKNCIDILLPIVVEHYILQNLFGCGCQNSEYCSRAVAKMVASSEALPGYKQWHYAGSINSNSNHKRANAI